jgi:hypothetical protein
MGAGLAARRAAKSRAARKPAQHQHGQLVVDQGFPALCQQVQEAGEHAAVTLTVMCGAAGRLAVPCGIVLSNTSAWEQQQEEAAGGSIPVQAAGMECCWAHTRAGAAACCTVATTGCLGGLAGVTGGAACMQHAHAASRSCAVCCRVHSALWADRATAVAYTID